MDSEHHVEPPAGLASLEHLTGPSRDTITWLSGNALEVSVTSDRYIRVSEAQSDLPRGGVIAHLRRADDSYEIEAVEGGDIWVNGTRVTARRLENSDMIEFGTTGPLSRFRQYRENPPLHETLSDIVGDALAYLRASRRPFARRTLTALRDTLRRLALETTILFRVGVILAIAALTVLAYQQSRMNTLLQEQVETSSSRLESFAKAMARAREEALTPGDLEALRQEFKHGLTSNVDRLAQLERRSKASARVIAESASSVLFLQGAYGFREKSTGRMLRHVVDSEGRPFVTPKGQPLLSLEGKGPVAERQFIGTGFAVGSDGLLVTNRHVALPWENDADVKAFTGQGHEPVIIKFIAYLPGASPAGSVELVKASEDADLALLRWIGGGAPTPGLSLAETPSSAGDEVIVMGYPTGLRAMLAQAGEAFVAELQKTNNTDFWSVAERLAAEGHVAPLASRGIVGHVTSTTLVYDADTTHGGSGGPVLDPDGKVVAVNTAILPEYGGSNLGVPAAKVRMLLDEAEVR